ncbi:cyclic pyranopterin monophosphate synthase MoaC [Anoxynatronum buryatiense]|uniref:Cyclic pyranopterin monophosphate synthase n=1 Tax=Anoxynatronum buryatiense TaxID=489973 RepID=A0AA45WUV0_9CLOT|nr:cyclic pyranopterin monophosphate synthase MoaC [Anoxynatronum buryatiense]SMP49911.1 cyclic pyranopterin monophosphate synthase subunit MoaC [Anoxynatronum buryatiense]
MSKLTHFNEEGRAKMVEVGHKLNTQREATCKGSITMKPETLRRIIEHDIYKGDVLAVAQVAGIMAAKRTSELIPMCHNLFLSGADVQFHIDRENSRIEVLASVKTTGKTGVEMEALTAVSVTALTIYDMCKAIDKEMTITDICLLRKSGGKSGDYVRPGTEEDEIPLV